MDSNYMSLQPHAQGLIFQEASSESRGAQISVLQLSCPKQVPQCLEKSFYKKSCIGHAGVILSQICFQNWTL